MVYLWFEENCVKTKVSKKFQVVTIGIQKLFKLFYFKSLHREQECMNQSIVLLQRDLRSTSIIIIASMLLLRAIVKSPIQTWQSLHPLRVKNVYNELRVVETGQVWCQLNEGWRKNLFKVENVSKEKFWIKTNYYAASFKFLTENRDIK